MLTRDKAIKFKDLLKDAEVHLEEVANSPDACLIVRIPGKPPLVIQNGERYLDQMIRAERHRRDYVLDNGIQQRLDDVWDENYESLTEYPGEVPDTDLLELREAMRSKQRFDLLMDDPEIGPVPRKSW